MDGGAWWARVHGVAEADTTERLHFTSLTLELEKEMTTHSIILAWRIPWTEEPYGLWSMGLQESEATEQLHFRLHFKITNQNYLHFGIYPSF